MPQKPLSSTQILELIRGDAWMMQALSAVREIGLNDGWIVAGFVRHRVWDALHGYEHRSFPNDIDVVFFDPSKPAEADRDIEAQLAAREPDYPWEVYNQAHMHTYNGHRPYLDCMDSFSRWAETVSTIGVRLDGEDELHLAAPHGIQDLVEMIIRPTPHPDARRDVFEKRLLSKGWSEQWPQVRVERSTEPTRKA